MNGMQDDDKIYMNDEAPKTKKGSNLTDNFSDQSFEIMQPNEESKEQDWQITAEKNDS